MNIKICLLLLLAFQEDYEKKLKCSYFGKQGIRKDNSFKKKLFNHVTLISNVLGIES